MARGARLERGPPLATGGGGRPVAKAAVEAGTGLAAGRPVNRARPGKAGVTESASRAARCPAAPLRERRLGGGGRVSKL